MAAARRDRPAGDHGDGDPAALHPHPGGQKRGGGPAPGGSGAHKAAGRLHGGGKGALPVPVHGGAGGHPAGHPLRRVRGAGGAAGGAAVRH